MEIQSCVESSVFEYGSSVVRDTARSLQLLRAIEATITNLGNACNSMRGEIETGQNFIKELAVVKTTKPCDLEDKIEEQLLNAQEQVEVLHQAFSQCRAAALTDKALNNEDGVVDAYDEAIDLAALLHNTLNTLRWTINEHDISYESVDLNTKTFNKDQISELLADLDSIKDD